MWRSFRCSTDLREMALSFQFPDAFYRTASDVLARHPEIKHSWTFNEKKQRRELLIPKAEPTGFDVGVNCETYGLYPWAGDWVGAPWDVADPDPVEKRFEQVLALLRILISPESRLRRVSKGRIQAGVFVDFVTPTGWHGYLPDAGNLFAWFGERKETIYQNFHLPRRKDFNGEDPLWYEHYKWID